MHYKNKRLIPHIRPKYLLLIAGIVWFIAGANVFNIGIKDFMAIEVEIEAERVTFSPIDE